MYKEFLSPIEDVIEDARNGKMFILVDAEDRENEGDLVIPAQMATPEAVNFMAKYGRGLICLSMTGERAKQLNLQLMSNTNQSRHQTAFTVSIEAREGITTGISAHDRARTISVAIDPTKAERDIVSPGHVFPLVARDGGVLVRAGHTEAAVDIARLAGLYPAGVICEIMNEDGTMARLPDLVQFAQLHGLKIATIADLIAYRRKHDNLIHRAIETEIDTRYGGKFDLKVYLNTVEYAEHIALVKGDISTPEPVLVRMHAINVFDDMLGAEGKLNTHGGRADLLQNSMRIIEEEGRGVIVLIRDTTATVVSDMLLHKGDDDGQSMPRRLREYGVGAQILLDLGIHNMVLLSDTTRQVVGLDGYDLHIVGQEPISDNPRLQKSSKNKAEATS
ncbi:3,4-dihydroxy-2-butanone 4-phosphate synthase [Tepidicaulis marinus]|uniref:3,4-dihydroxy-2-butanone 4-phosphate synthase n=1 Tax=Tepidicaulis marinus TaxID=1333998 RepID=A0A081B7U4_9HYPH|nr:3,4-dihydroxy-2-butanone-4-phosphate synthase [Tepidicaulis marinus]GAK44112.1 3,4-dihydroxy-2-butanone 4-phosphate synthase [Tepidicaulis marinus]